MRPLFKIIANGADITAKIADRLIELRLHDEAGQNSDTATIILDNRDHCLRIPAKGAELQISIGYKETGLIDKGLFTVDETRLSGPPHRMAIKAKAGDMRKSLKAQRSTSYDGLTLGDLVKTIAARHNLQPKCGADLAIITPGHIDQTEESDLHLLTRLAQQYGAVAKPANGCLLFVPTGEAKSASGQTLTPVTVDLELDGGSYDFTAADRKNYGAVTARYRDKAANTDIDVTVTTADDDSPTYTLRNTYPDEAAAKAAAKAKLGSLKRGTVTLSLDGIRGMPAASAEAPLTVSGICGEVDAIAWVIKDAEHALTNSGFTTRIEAEVK